MKAYLKKKLLNIYRTTLLLLTEVNKHETGG